MSLLKISHTYNPNNQSAEELIGSFVIRTNQFTKIYQDIVSTPLQSSAQHYLIEGQRGTGKTTLLLRLQYELELKNKDFVVIRFPEEQYGIFTLYHLWQAVVDELEETKEFLGISNHFDQYIENVSQQDGFDVINRYLKESKKRLVLLIDNVGDIFKRFSEIELSQLRDIFHTTNYIQLIGASATTLEHTFKHDKPFYEFFKRIKLLGLNQKDAITLITQLAKRYNKSEQIQEIITRQPQRIEILRRMTGGIPRTIVLLFEILIDQNESVFEDLEVILDKVTPLYKHRMDDLPTQQQSIVNAMALNWDGISSKEIVTSLKSNKFNTKKVSAQLKELERQQIVEGRLVNKKDKIYFIKERFFNIWYLMRFGRKKNRQRVKWLIRFLEEWCEPDEIKSRATNLINLINNSEVSPKQAYYQAQSLSGVIKDDLDLQDKILETAGQYLSNCNSQFAKDLSTSDLSQLFERADLNDIVALEKLGNYYLKTHDYKKAEGTFKKAIGVGSERSKYNLGLLYQVVLNNKKKAELLYLNEIKNKLQPMIYFLASLYALNKEFDLDYIEKKLYDITSKYHDQKEITFHALSMIYFERNKYKAKSLLLIDKYLTKSINQEPYIILAMKVQLWNDKFDESFKSFKIWYESHKYKKAKKQLTNYFMLLLAKDQHHKTLELFNKYPNLKDEIKPVYFALMTLLKDEYPKEHLKMGSELESTVDEVLEKVKDYAEKYN